LTIRRESPTDARDRYARKKWAKGDEPPRVVTKIDWEEYFQEFRRVHGLFPLVHKGRLLFPDGWTYSMTDYRGPEWPPPDDEVELRRLCLSYWYLRRKAIRRDLKIEQWRLDDVRALVGSRSCKLQQSTMYFDQESRRIVKTKLPLDVTQFEGRVAWLETALAECEEMIVYYQEKTHGDSKDDPDPVPTEEAERSRP
jgi:hypothetical protein